MTIPLMSYAPSSQNQRVADFEVPGDEKLMIYRTETADSASNLDKVIWAAYRQIYNEQQLLVSNRQPSLESKLKAGQITVREFMRGLVLSPSFRQYNYEPNNNYRFVKMCIQRLLGRDVYSEKEKLAWSIVLATKGIEGFIDRLLTSKEYQANFGENIVPYQRRRILPQRAYGELPFARMPRYGEDYRIKLENLGYFSGEGYYNQPYLPPKPVLLVGKILAIAGASILVLGTIAVALTAWGLINI